MRKEDLNDQNKEKLKILVKNKFGKPLNSVKSFEELSESIFLSVQTLRRFFGKIDIDKQIGLTSLSILCKYVGYYDWQDFCHQHEFGRNLLAKDKNYIENMFVFFENGQRYNIDYYQNTMVVDTLNDYAKVIYHKKENLQFFYSIYQKNNWCCDYFLAWLPNYNFFGQDWFRKILIHRINNSKNILVKLALTNFLFLGSFLSNDNCESSLDIADLDEIFKKYRENFQYMPYHEMCYHTIKLILAKKDQDEEEFDSIIKRYFDGLENSGLQEIHQQEMLIFFCNTLLWLEEYTVAYQYLKKAKPFLKSFPKIKEKEKSMHFFGINMVFVKTTFALAWSANKDSNTDDFELTDFDFNDITGLLYNDYIKIMYLAKCILSENGLVKKKFLFKELQPLVEDINYYEIYRLLQNLDSDFSRYSA